MKPPIHNLQMFVIDETVYQQHRWNKVFLDVFI
jgi:hypothetical protein